MLHILKQNGAALTASKYNLMSPTNRHIGDIHRRWARTNASEHEIITLATIRTNAAAGGVTIVIIK
jgi:hypothetical protein